MKKFDLKKVFIYVSLIALLFIFLLQFFNIYALILGLILIFILYICNKNIPKFALILFILMFLIRLGIILIVKTPVVSDFQIILNATLNLLKHHNIMNSEIYFWRYGYQTGQVLYQFGLLKIFNSITFLKIVNCLFSSLNCVLIYLIAKEFVSQKSAQKASILYGFLAFPMFYNTVLSNQIPGSTFFYLGIYILLKNKNSLINYVLAAICLFLGNFLRNEGIVFICAIIGLYIFYIISKKADKKLHIGMILLVLSYFLLNIGVSSVIKFSHINNEGLSNNYVEYKFLLGSNYSTCGGYTNADGIYMKSKETAQKEIVNRIKKLGIRGSVELIGCKSKKTWSGGDLYWTFLNVDTKNHNILGLNLTTEDLQIILNSFNKLIYYIAFLLMIYGLFKTVKKKEYDIRILLFINILAINFIVYSLIEVQSRYIYLLQISIFILASLGFEELNKKIPARAKLDNKNAIKEKI